MEFPERLRRLRDKNGIKRYILSQRCGLHPDAIRRYERGEAEPDLRSLIAIADFFGVSLDYLCGRDQDRSEGSRPKKKKKRDRDQGLPLYAVTVKFLASAACCRCLD